MLSLETCQKLKDADFIPIGDVFSLIGRLAYYRRNGETIYCACNEAWEGDDLLCYDYSLEELLEAIREIGSVKMLRIYAYNEKICRVYANIDGGDCVHSCDESDLSEAAAALWLKLRDLDA